MKNLKILPLIFILTFSLIACSGGSSSSSSDDTTEGADVSAIDGTTIEPTDKFSFSAQSSIDQLSATTSNFFITPAPSVNASISKGSTTYTIDDCVAGNALPATASFPQDDEIMITLESDIANGNWLGCVKELPLEAGTTESEVFSFTVAGGSDPSFAGTLDTLFGGGEGYVSLDFTAFDGNDGSQIRFDSSGNIYFGAYVYNESEDEDDFDDGYFYVWKLDSLGNVDTSFGTNGLVDISYPDGGMGMFWVFDDSSVLLVARGAGDGEDEELIRMVKLTDSGVVDTSFGTNGIVEYSTFERSEPAAVVADDDGYIYISGASTISGGNDVATIWKFDSAGNIVSGFGSNGAVRWSEFQATLISAANNIEILSDGNILASGEVSGNEQGDPEYIYFWKFDSDGNMISSFGEGGVADTGIQLESWLMTVDSDGYIYVGWQPG